MLVLKAYLAAVCDTLCSESVLMFFSSLFEAIFGSDSTRTPPDWVTQCRSGVTVAAAAAAAAAAVTPTHLLHPPN